MKNINTGKRKSGVLLHISSLSENDGFGIGTLGEQAYKFVDFLKQCKQSLWQILPLGPTGYGNSPYSAYSAFAGNPYLIDISEFQQVIKVPEKLKNSDKVDYKNLELNKIQILKKIAYKEINSGKNTEFEFFCVQNSFWLEDYALFSVLKELNKNKAFSEFEKDIFLRKKDIIANLKIKLKQDIEIVKYIQFIFSRQWQKLKKYANDSRIEIIGDMPFYVASDSADLWSKPEIFVLDKQNKPSKVAGVPPDYFSKTGQLWGNPVYDWENAENELINWWIERIKFNAQMFDYVRIDHFRALADFWAVDADAKTAEIGEWLPAKGDILLAKIQKQVPSAKIIAEDLGDLSDPVLVLRDKYDLPGMKILQFAFGSDSSNDFLPHLYRSNSVVYTGTHDNDTTLSWLQKLDKISKDYLIKYSGNKNPDCNTLIRLAWASVSDMAIVQMQDILNLDEKSRMNTPGTAENNWIWRLKQNSINSRHIEFLTEITEIYGRC